MRLIQLWELHFTYLKQWKTFKKNRVQILENCYVACLASAHTEILRNSSASAGLQVSPLHEFSHQLNM